MSRVGVHSISTVRLSMLMLLFLAHDAAGGLYQCRTEEGTVYTDTPGQLKSCTPISQGVGPSNLGLVGVPATGSAPLAPHPALPYTVVPSSPDTSFPLAPVPVVSPENTPSSSPCPTGINPLNPLSAPPCPSSDTAPPSMIPGPADTIVQPPVPAQP